MIPQEIEFAYNKFLNISKKYEGQEQTEAGKRAINRTLDKIRKLCNKHDLPFMKTCSDLAYKSGIHQITDIKI